MATLAARTMDIDPGALLGEPGGRSAVDGLVQGTQVGRYLVLGTLGAGGMGVVYAAYDPKLERKIALKLVHSGVGGDRSGARVRLLREAQAMAKLSHPNVVTVHDVGTFGEQVFVAMEFVDGRTFAEWLAQKRRSRREIVAVMTAAGRGLEAAHAKNLVHRDFKPENVMIAEDGRVLVMDFGLARSEVLGEKATSETSRILTDIRRGDALGLAKMAITQAGGLLGTPAYMSPEQFLGDPADARSDQFSFCVTLYEALYGERPFAGAQLGELLIAVTDGRVRPEPRGSRVPRWIRAVLLRGMSVEKSARYESMASLLDDLARDPSGRRRITAVAVGVGALALAVFAGMRTTEYAAQAVCEREGAAIGDVWSEAKKSQLRASMLDSGVPHAEDTYDRVLPWIDRWASRWRDERTQMCVRHDVEGTLDDDLWSRAESCFDQQRLGLEVMLEQYQTVDARTLPSVVTNAATFAQLESCADPSFLALRPSAPRDEQGRPVAGLEAVRTEIVRAKTLEIAGDVPAAVERARAALDEAHRLNWTPITSEARLELGRLYGESGRYSEAMFELRKSFTDASSSGDDLIAARAAIQLSRLLGFQLARPDEALVWSDVAASLLDRLGRADTLDGAALANNTGLAHQSANDLASAEQAHQRALQLRVALLGDKHPEDAHSYGNLGNVATARGNLDEARTWHWKALEARRSAYGNAHPDTARSLNNLGNVELAAGNPEQARELYAEAVEVWRPSLGEAHPATARGYANLGRAHQALGDDAAALTWLKRGYEVMVDAVGEAHPKATAVRADLETLCEHDRYAPACAYLGLAAPAPPSDEAETIEADEAPIAQAGEPPSAP